MKEEVKKAARIFYNLKTINELEEEGLHHLDGSTSIEKLNRMFELLKEEEITDKKEMIFYIMRSTKGWNNPKIISEFLDRKINGK